jgi:hypothetical protein
MTQPQTAGPNRDGSKSLAKESKVGIATTVVLTILAQGAIEWLGSLNLATGAGAAGVAAVIGLLTAYLKRNR